MKSFNELLESVGKTIAESANSKEYTSALAKLEKDALRELGWKTFASRNMDNLDFHDIGVVTMKKLLHKAFESGFRSGVQASTTSKGKQDK